MTIYNKILDAWRQVAHVRKGITEFPVPQSMQETVEILIEAELKLENAAKKYCDSREEYDPFNQHKKQ